MKKFLTVAIAIFIIGCSVKNPELKLPTIISDNMVLQQNKQVNLWGWSSPKAKIVVESSWGKTAEAVTGTDGKWMAQLETPAAGGPFTITIKAGETVKTINNVMVGEVWLCSGQSNMEMPNERLASEGYH